jgi:hypothetical protein
MAAVPSPVASLQGRSTRGQGQALWPHVVRATKSSAARLALKPAIHRFATCGLRSSVQRSPLFASPHAISHMTRWPAAERAKLETKRRATIISKCLSDQSRLSARRVPTDRYHADHLPTGRFAGGVTPITATPALNSPEARLPGWKLRALTPAARWPYALAP